MTSPAHESDERKVATEHWKRRGLLAGVAALASAGVAKLLGAERAEAGHDATNVFHLGVTENLWGTAVLSVGATDAAGMQVTNFGGGQADGFRAIIPFNGSTLSSTRALWAYNGAAGTGILGQSVGPLAPGVMGIASKSSGVVGFTNDGTLPAGWVPG